MIANDAAVPENGKSAFVCPICDVYAHQRWGTIMISLPQQGNMVTGMVGGKCGHCEEISLWRSGSNVMLHPKQLAPYKAPADLPNDMKVDFDEASEIVGRSPRGAAALLRLVIQKLCCHILGTASQNLNADIGVLVQRGLPPGTQKALDIVRVIGNHAVHPGTIDLNDTPEVAHRLFDLVRFITEKMITEPAALEHLYSALPEGTVKQIEKRDKKALPAPG